MRNHKLTGLDESDRIGTYYFAYAQKSHWRNLSLVVKTAVEPHSLSDPLRAAIAALDPRLPILDLRTMEERIAGSLVTRRSRMLLSSIFGGVALFLSAIGIYSVLAYLVSQRTREMGIRMALGATSQRIFKMVLNEGLVIVGLGTAAGLTAAFALRASLASQLYGVRPLEPGVILVVSALLGLASLAACLIPSRRAMKVDPIEALGYG